MISVGSIGRIATAAGKLMFMDAKFSEVAEKTLKASKKAQGWKNIHKQIGDCFVKAEKATANESFWSGLKKQVTELPKDLKAGWAAKGAWGKFLGVGGQLVKRLPLIFVAMELPNIFSAFKDEGLVGGILETGKTVIRSAASMAGFIIGQTLIPIPIVGGLVGCFATDWLTGKILGKSHTEKKEEKKEAALAQANNAEAQALALQQQLGNQTNPFVANQYTTPTMSYQQMLAMQQMLYSGGSMNDDFMANLSGINRLNYLG